MSKYPTREEFLEMLSWKRLELRPWQLQMLRDLGHLSRRQGELMILPSRAAMGVTRRNTAAELARQIRALERPVSDDRKLREAKDAIDRVFSDRSRPVAETRSALVDLRDHIDFSLDALPLSEEVGE